MSLYPTKSSSALEPADESYVAVAVVPSVAALSMEAIVSRERAFRAMQLAGSPPEEP